MTLRKDVSKALVKDGFKRNGRLHQLRIDQDFSFWVDTGPLEARSDIAPFIGIRHNPTQSLVAELQQRIDDPWVGTVGANVGYILGVGYQTWAPPSVVADVMPALAAAFERLREFLNIEKLADAWKIEGAQAPGWQYKLIAVLVLKNDPAAVEQALASAASQLCKTQNVICEDFRAFEARLRQRYTLAGSLSPK